MSAYAPLPIRRLGAASLCVVAALASAAIAGSDSIQIGWDDLLGRIGAAALPNGQDVVVAQVEAPVGGANYGPNQSLGEFAGKTFIPQSGPPGVSGHASSVGLDFYGNVSSVAPGITIIHLYEANTFLLGAFLQTDPMSDVPPMAMPGPIKIFNSSWVGAFDNPQSPTYNPAMDINALRRGDLAVLRDDTLFINGVGNDEPGPGDGAVRPLLAHMYNGLAVGVRDGTHTHDPTLSSIDGPGRLKPEIVAPGNATSFATPVVSAVAAMLVETTQTDSTLSRNPNADRSDVLKCIMLAGAKPEAAHGMPWTNNPSTSGPTRGITTQPIDAVVGAGTVNVNISHLILTGDEQNGSTSVPSTSTARFDGWDLNVMGTSATDRNRYWRFHFTAPVEELVFAATWHRSILALPNVVGVGNFDLQLRRIDATGKMVSLIGDAGLPYFASGNIASQSTIDNIEMMRIQDLAPGDYVLHLRRVDNVTGFPPMPVATAWHITHPPLNPADINGDGVVNGLDLGMLLFEWSIPPTAPGCSGLTPCPPDINNDGFVNGLDLGLLLNAWTF